MTLTYLIFSLNPMGEIQIVTRIKAQTHHKNYQQKLGFKKKKKNPCVNQWQQYVLEAYDSFIRSLLMQGRI